jgi:hypothetical protein
MATETTPLSHLADSILYLSSMLRVGARRIDFYIDYFGGTPRTARPAAILTDLSKGRGRRHRLGRGGLGLAHRGA